MSDWKLLAVALAFVGWMATLRRVNRQAMKMAALLVLGLAGYKTVPLLVPMFTPSPERAAQLVDAETALEGLGLQASWGGGVVVGGAGRGRGGGGRGSGGGGGSALDSVPNVSALVTATGQDRDTTWFESLRVDTLQAGASYVDSISGLRVCVVTDFARDNPTNNSTFTVPYSNGSQVVSGGWLDGATVKHTVAVFVADANDMLLVDIAPPCTISNWRGGPAGAIGMQDFTFANNRATPQIAYFERGDSLHEYNTATDTEVTSGDFPVPFRGSGGWLQSDGADTVFAAINSGGPDSAIVLFRSDSTTVLASTSVFNEPYLEMNGVYVLLQQGGAGDDEMHIWNPRGTPGSWIDTTTSGGNYDMYHSASLYNRWTGVDVNTGASRNPHHSLRASTGAHTTHLTDLVGYCGLYHNGNGWKQRNAAEGEQWYTVAWHVNATAAFNNCAGARGVSLVSIGSAQPIKWLVNEYNDPDANNGYWGTGFGQQSVDGWWYCFGSDRNALGGAVEYPNQDLLCARLPLSAP